MSAARSPARPGSARLPVQSDRAMSGTAMKSARWLARRGALCLAAVLSPAAAPAQIAGATEVPHAITANGVVVPTPEIATLDCAGITQTLRRIDQSNYRQGEALNPLDRDWPIFVYEDRLARAYYTECMLHDKPLGDPGDAFSFGFDAQ